MEREVPELLALVERAARPSALPAEADAARDAAGNLFAACQDRIYWSCLRLVGRPELAAELAQETMLIAWRRLPEFRGQSSFYVWLYAIARFVSPSGARALLQTCKRKLRPELERRIVHPGPGRSQASDAFGAGA